MRSLAFCILCLSALAGEVRLPRVEVTDLKGVKTTITSAEFLKETRGLLGTDTESLKVLEIKRGDLSLEVNIEAITELSLEAKKIEVKTKQETIEGEIENPKVIVLKGQFSTNVSGKITLERVKSLKVLEEKQ